MAFARWSKSSTSTCIFGGAVQLFSFSFSFFWGDDFLSFSGEGNFWGDVFSFWSGGGAFFVFGDFFFFTWVGGSPLVGEKRAFMAEPSAWPVITDMLLRQRGGVNVKTKKNKNMKR